MEEFLHKNPENNWLVFTLASAVVHRDPLSPLKAFQATQKEVCGDSQ
jgi:hypothetical protein